MNELSRMQYLHTFGIDCFVPRFILPAAKVSGPCSLSPSVAPEAASGGVEGFSVRAVPAPENHRGRSDETTAGEPGATAPANSAPQRILSPVVEMAVSSQASARFSLALWRVSASLQVIDSHRRGEALPTHALLQNMLAATELLASDLPKAEHLHWPMVETHHDASWTAARQMAQGFFEGRFAENPVVRLLLLGEDAFNVVLGGEEAFAESIFSRVAVEAFGATALVLPSLSELLSEPQLKCRAWLVLQTLREDAGGDR